MVRFSKELFGSANRFVRENAPEANPSGAIHKQTHLSILGRDTTNKGGGRCDRRLESFSGYGRQEIFATSSGKTPSKLKKIRELLRAI
jgi:hypothetical protein